MRDSVRSSARSYALVSAVALVALCAALVVRAGRLPAVVPATAADTVFSAERAMRHVRAVAQRPHPLGSADHARVRAYVVAELEALGLDAQLQATTAVGTRYQAAGRVSNVLARMPGRTPGGPAVLLVAHYDGVPASPAAGDDGSGVAVLLETLRALRAGAQPAHDVIALFTDGEEAGLLGAAAFVREHPWAREVGVALNFEARGTSGRTSMFETGAGNLDAVRVLRGAPDVSASSLTVTVYRSLPNDTDFSELAVLGQPGLNFAFIDGVSRYHTAYDDPAHLDVGSVQHEGAQALALVRAFGNGPLPRPRTGDAVFFDFPFFGLVLYPESWAMPSAILAATLVVVVLVAARRRGERRLARDVVVGALMTIVATTLAGAGAFGAGAGINWLHATFGWEGSPPWRGIYAAAIVMLSLAIAAACWALARRRSGATGTLLGALVVWAALSIFHASVAPGASHFFVWPLVGVAVATLVVRGGGPGDAPGARAAVWIATGVALAFLVPVIYVIGALALGAVATGAVVMGIFVALLAWLLAAQLEGVSGERRWRVPLASLAAAVLLFVVGAATVRRSSEHPATSALVYTLDADGTGAWLASASAGPGSWAARALGDSTLAVTPGSSGQPGGPPEWITRALYSGFRVPMSAAAAPRVGIAPPEATVLSDSLAGAERRLVVRVRAAPGTLALHLRAVQLPVLRSAVDGRAVDTTRYRRRSSEWQLTYWAPPDSGLTLSLTIAAGAESADTTPSRAAPTGAAPALEIMAQSAGIPEFPAVHIPARPLHVVPAQTGDMTVVYRLVRL